MTRRMYWGFAILILLLGTAAVFIIQHERAENRQLAKEKADLEALINRLDQQKQVNKPPREAKVGFKWEWHGDHWCETPLVSEVVPKTEHKPTPIGVLDDFDDLKDYLTFFESNANAELPFEENRAVWRQYYDLTEGIDYDTLSTSERELHGAIRKAFNVAGRAYSEQFAAHKAESDKRQREWHEEMFGPLPPDDPTLVGGYIYPVDDTGGEE